MYKYTEYILKVFKSTLCEFVSVDYTCIHNYINAHGGMSDYVCSQAFWVPHSLNHHNAYSQTSVAQFKDFQDVL